MKNLFILLVYTLFYNITFSQSKSALQLSAPFNFNAISNVAYANSFLTQGGAVRGWDNGENIKGSRFLFDSFLEGVMKEKNNEIINKGETYFFNYDKITQILILTQDNIHYFVPEDEKIIYVKIINGSEVISFEKVPIISTNFYVQLLEGSSGYRLYKSTKTVFKKASTSNNGLINNDNTNSAFIDDNKYYVVFPDNSFKQVSFSKKSLLEVFNHEEAKLKDFFEKTKYKNITEFSLRAFIRALN